MRIRVALQYLGALVMLVSPHARADAARAEAIVTNKCFICHGMEGESSSRQYAKLAGQHAQYIAKQLDDFHSGRRKSDTMRAMVADLTAEEMMDLGQYFESRPSPAAVKAMAPNETGKNLFKMGSPAKALPPCATCHGERAFGTPLLPRLAGQRVSYLEAQLKMFNQRTRTNDNAVMQDIAVLLTDTEIKAVAEYLASIE